MQTIFGPILEAESAGRDRSGGYFSVGGPPGGMAATTIITTRLTSTTNSTAVASICAREGPTSQRIPIEPGFPARCPRGSVAVLACHRRTTETGRDGRWVDPGHEAWVTGHA